MKKILVFVGVLMFVANLFAQTLDDVGRLSIFVQRPNDASIPSEAINILDDKMHQIITSSGISENAFVKDSHCLQQSV